MERLDQKHARLMERIILDGSTPGISPRVNGLPRTSIVSILEILDNTNVDNNYIKKYREYAAAQVKPFVTSYPDGTREHTLAMAPISGGWINLFMYLTGPDREYGLDRADVIQDPKLLFEETQSHSMKLMLARHRRLPGWQPLVEETVRDLAKVVEDDRPMDRRTAVGQGKVAPVLRWRTSPEGVRRWVMGHEPGSLAVRLDRYYRRYYTEIEDWKLSSITGLLVAAAYSRSVVNRWPDVLNYNADPPIGNETFQRMGVIQSVGLVVMKSVDLLDNPDPRTLVNTTELACKAALAGRGIVH